MSNVKTVTLKKHANEGNDIREGSLVIAEGLHVGKVTAMVINDCRIETVQGETIIANLCDLEKVKIELVS